MSIENKILRDALKELFLAQAAEYPPESAGIDAQDAQDAWAKRREDAMENARTIVTNPCSRNDQWIHSIVSGAIFDFAGYLTTRPDLFEVGSTANANQIADHIKEWVSLRGLDSNTPLIDSWQDEIVGAQQSATSEDEIEESYWRYDARHKGYDQWKNAPMSERDAFKAEFRNFTIRKPFELSRLLSSTQEKVQLGQNEDGYELVCISPNTWLSIVRDVRSLNDSWNAKSEDKSTSCVANDGDPCPGCMKGAVCRTPACGRLKLPVDHPYRSTKEQQ